MTTIDADTPALLIGGERVAAQDTIPVLNPATGEEFARAPDCTAAQVDAAFEAASAAFPSWAADAEARRALLKTASKALRGAVDELAPLLVAEQGKPLHEAKEEVLGSSYWLSYYARLVPPEEVIRDDERARVEVLRRPVGVVAAITPWNFPLLLACWKLGPALAAGCTVVLKPSPLTPLSTLRMGEILTRELPAGVLNVVSGQDRVGPWLTAHPRARKISFTGSIATGRRVAASAAEELKRVTLELGGNDAAIVLPDADPARIAKPLFWSAFANAGQICCAVKRIYAPDAIHDELVAALAEQVRAVQVGDGMAPGTMIGPLQNAPQRDRVKGLVEAAAAAGAEVISGSAPEGSGGNFLAPTIVAGARRGMALVDEEQFGPALPVIRYADLDDAIGQANGTEYGLDASVWGDDERAAATAARLDAGTVWVNTHLANDPAQPFGGVKQSGIGTENGLRGLEQFTEPQVIHRAKPRVKP